MPEYQYLIIGGGMTAAAALKAIREIDAEGSIGLISAEDDPPYDRPPLTKGLWKGKPVQDIWRPTEESGAELHLGRRIRILDAERKQAVDDQDTEYAFDQLLLATGGRPRRLMFGDEGIIYYRTLEDYRRLRDLTAQNNRFAVIGGGFIGAEIAAALAMNDKEVVILFPEAGIGGLRFPTDLAQSLNEYYRQKGVEVLPGELVSGLEKRGKEYVVKTKSGQEVAAEGVVAGLGIRPNVELAEAAGIQTDDGIVVDEFLRTNYRNIYAAGDVANFYNPALDKRLRVEHEDNANSMGAQVGRNMAGEATPYNYLPYFYSDLFDLGYEAIGETNADLETVSDWEEPYRKGVVYYLRAGRVRGIILWNVWGQVDAARDLIAQAGPFRPDDLKGRLPA
jgi:3-phenylpropionate/trans-cinnamate dioxygenase ferredoxin reductase subunit